MKEFILGGIIAIGIILQCLFMEFILVLLGCLGGIYIIFQLKIKLKPITKRYFNKFRGGMKKWKMHQRIKIK